jgi:hypothetical protein
MVQGGGDKNEREGIGGKYLKLKDSRFKSWNS